jgi:hypothetical protein
VYGLLGGLMEKLAVEQPAQPIEFLLHALRQPKAPMRVIVAGPPGAGRTSVATRVASEFGLVHVSPGELLRSEVRARSPVGEHVAAFMQRGELVPDEIVIPLVKSRIQRADCVANGWQAPLSLSPSRVRPEGPRSCRARARAG